MNKLNIIFLAPLIILLLTNYSFSNLSQTEAIEIALKEVLYMAQRDTADLWTEESQVSQIYPIYLDGIEGVSYYECKITTNNLDAGYVLVNVNFTDIPIVESSMEGKTLTERYEEFLGNSNFKLFRYDWIRSAAAVSTITRSTTVTDFLATTGFDLEEGYQTRGGCSANALSIIDIYRTQIEESQCFPFFSPGLLDEFYYDTVPEGERFEGPTRGEWKSIDAELLHRFPNGCHTPSWSQFKRPSGKPIGCGATAWTILYGYWRQFKGKSSLFDGLNLMEQNQYGGYIGYYNNSYKDHGTIKECAMDLYDYMGSFEVSGNTATYPSRMPYGISYAVDKGYINVTAKDNNGTEYNKFDIVYNEMRNDRPVILYMELDKDDENGIPAGCQLHYVVIEGAHKSQYKYISKWHNRNVSYLVNLGWAGFGRKWLYVRDWGANQHEVHGSFSAFTINVGMYVGERDVDFTVNKTRGTNPLNVTFTSIESGDNPNSSSDDPYIYFWDFDDGSYSYEQNPTHIFTKPGKYTITHYILLNDFTIISEIKTDFIEVIPDITPILNLLLLD